MRCLTTLLLILLLESVVVASGLGDVNNMVRPRTAADSTEDPRASAWVERADFLAYFWPSFRELSRDSITIWIEHRMNQSVRSEDGTDNGLDYSIYTIETRSSPFFRSTYRLIYVILPETFVGMGPQTMFFVEHPDSESIFALDTTVFHERAVTVLIDDQRDRMQDLMIDTTMANYISSDLNHIDWDSSSVVQMAFEAISLVSFYRPTIVLDDAMEIYEYSNAVAGDDLWEQYVTTDHDTISTLLTSVLIHGVRGNRYFDGNYEHAKFDFEEFAPYDSIVSPPTCGTLDGSDFEATIFTWSPASGALNQWTIRVSKSKKLDIQCQIIAREIGITFSSY